jgi:hypothetical protein
MTTPARVSRRLVALALPALALGLGACEDTPKPADPAATPPPAQPAGGRVAPGAQPAQPAEPAPSMPSTAKPDHGLNTPT